MIALALTLPGALAFAQAPVPGLAGGFEIDGNLRANNPGVVIGLGDDWLTGVAGPGSALLAPNGTPLNAATTFHFIDLTGNGDADVFDGSNKVIDNPNTYKWKSGSAPQKDDIQHGLVYMSVDENGDHWVSMAGDRRSVNGESYIDYEFLQASLIQNANGTFTSNGPDGGRTVGDMVLTIHLANGGSQAEFYAQRWTPDGEGGFTYVTVPVPPGAAFVAANIDSAITSSYPVFGGNTYAINQFGEAAVNLDMLLPNFDNCFGFATMFIRTKSSTSDDAVLKDFMKPVNIQLCLDDEMPILTAPGDVTLTCSDSTEPGMIGVATATDNCAQNPNVTHKDTIVPGGCPENYTIMREWTATDNCGNSATAMQTISVVDNQAPTVDASPGPLTVSCIGDVPAPNVNLIQTSGECGEVSVIHLSDVSNGATCPEIITRTYRASDACGNSVDVTQIITVDDNIAPTADPLAPITIACRDDVPAANIALVNAADNCGTPTVTHVSDTSDGKSCPEVITRRYRVTDACGNSVDVVQTITVDDDVKPEIFGPQDITVACADGIPAANIQLIQATDNCGVPTVIHVGDVSDGKSCPETITRTYRATDACGNSSDFVQKITVDDDVAPQITAGPQDIAVLCSDGIPAANIGLIQTSDNCGVPTVTHVGDQSDGKSCPEVITRTYRSTDACGNYSDFVQKITVDDDVRPTADPLGEIKVSCESNIPAVDPSVVRAADNCSAVNVIHVGDASDGKYCPEIIVRTYRVFDACGNFIDVTQRITVDDDIAPTVTSGPADMQLACDASVPAADVDLIDAADNCGSVVVTHLGDQSDGKTCPMTITRTYRVSDGCGNAVNYVQKLTIGDDEPPVLGSCGEDKTVECPVSLNFDRPTATDNCDDNPSVRVVRSDSTLGPEAWTYRVTRTFQAFDECGNASAECDQTITAHCEVDALCSFTQGFYGNYGGKFNNVPTIEIIRSLLKDNPLVVGKPGRSLKFNYNAADCIIARLPAGKTATTLPAIGDAVMNKNTCQTSTPIPVDSQGKFQNVFLGQTITLSLNARLSPWMNLFPLTESFCTQGALPGPDGKLGTPDDVINPASAVETYHIHPTVLTALDNLGLPRLVAGLIELCNRGLAAQPTGGASLAAISSAADAINNGFDGCRFIVDCEAERVVIMPGTKMNDGEGAATLMPTGPAQFELRQNAPNPFNPATSIRIAIPKATSWSLAIYDVRGRLVRSFDGTTGGPQFVDLRWDGTDERGAPVSSGVYFYRVNAADFRDVKKMVLLK